MSSVLYRLVTINPSGAAFTPGDATVSDDHFWVTSRRRRDHPWIKAPPTGEGQSLDIASGRTTDGQYTVPVIDVPEETCVEWTATEVLDFAGLGLAADYLGAGGWSIGGTFAPGTYPNPTIHGWWDALTPDFAGSALFMWVDQGVMPLTLGPWIRESYITKTITGLTPGQTYGLTFELNWVLDTGAGNIFLELIGATADRLSLSTPGITIWDITTLENDTLLRLRAQADAFGQLTIRMGGEGYAPSCNAQCSFDDVTLQELNCTQTGVGPGTRYVTGQLADVYARQQQLGRLSHICRSFDGGATWTPWYTGYCTGIAMQDSLVYEFTISDTRRVERTRRAFRDIAPASSPNFVHMTALVGGPIYRGFHPYNPVYSPQVFEVVDQRPASGTLDEEGHPDGWVKLRWLNPGYSSAARFMVSRLLQTSDLSRDAEEFFEPFPPGYTISNANGAYPGLRATLLAIGPGGVLEDDLIPLSQGRVNSTTPSSAVRGMVGRLLLASHNVLINSNRELYLRWGIEDNTTYPNGQLFNLLLTPREVSEKFPLYWRGHPADLFVALYDENGIPYDAASVTVVKQAMGEDLVVVLRFVNPDERIEEILARVGGFFGFSTYVDGSGNRVFFSYRTFITAPSNVIGMDDLVREGGPTFELDEGSRRNRVVLRQQYFSLADDDNLTDNPSGLAAIAATATFDYSTDGGATRDADIYGPLEEAFEIPGHVCLAKDRLVNGDLQSSSPVNLTQWGLGVARGIFSQMGRGLQYLTIAGRRDTDVDNVVLGSEVESDITHVPNAQLGQAPTSQRGGTRFWRAVQRVETEAGANLRLADANTGVAYGETVTLILNPDTEDPARFYRLSIANSSQLLSDGAWLALEISLDGIPAGSAHGVYYTVFDGTMMKDSASIGQDPWITRIGPFPVGSALYVRAAGFLVGGAIGAWTPWTGLGGSQTPGAGLSGLSITNVTATTATLAWSNTDVTNQVRVEYRLNDTGAYTTFSTDAIGTVTKTITGLAPDTLYGVRVVLWDGVAEVGTPLTGALITGLTGLSGLVISSITANTAILQWGNGNNIDLVKVEYKLDTETGYTFFALLPAGSINGRLSGLVPSTDYDVRVILVTALGVEVGSELTGSFTTLGTAGTLNPPTNPRVFAGVDPSGGGLARGVYGISVLADASNPGHWIVIEEAVETAVGSGTYGAYTEVSFVPAQYGSFTIWTTTCPNDGKRRSLRAFSRANNYSDSAPTAANSIDPWAVQPPTGVPLFGVVNLTTGSIAEDASEDLDFPLAPGSTLTSVEVTSSHSSRLQLYESAAARTADAGRDYVQLPLPGSGVLLDIVFPPGFYDLNLNPLVQIIDRSGNYLPEVTVWARITCYEPGSNVVTMSINYQLPSSTGGGV